MTKEVDGFVFSFPDAIDLFIFDEKDNSKATYHGLSHALKAVDLLVELDDNYLFIEVKDFFEPEQYKQKEPFNYLREVLKAKYKDSWIYRWAENKIDKPIHYLCLMILENSLNTRLTKELRSQIPTKIPTSRWNNEIATNAIVLNLETWNRNFPKWPLTRVSQAGAQ
jgi:hypothetical protein